MQLICSRNLTNTEPKFKILTLGTYYSNQLPKAGTRIEFVDRNGHSQGTGRIHRSGIGRIDGLSWWYKQNRHVVTGNRVSIYKMDNDKYMLEVSLAINNPQAEVSVQPIDNDGDGFSRLLEKDLENYLLKNKNIECLEEGLKVISNQYHIKRDDIESENIIDILAKDNNNNYVVIELKAGEAKREVISQIQLYIKLVKNRFKESGKEVKGIIVAHKFHPDVKESLPESPKIVMKEYNVNFSFSDIK